MKTKPGGFTERYKNSDRFRKLQKAINKGAEIEYKERTIYEDKRMPSVKKMGLKDALYLLEKKGLKVRVEGYGRIYAQDPAANTKVYKGQHVLIKARN